MFFWYAKNLEVKMPDILYSKLYDKITRISYMIQCVLLFLPAVSYWHVYEQNVHKRPEDMKSVGNKE
jgi:hypothetical protein